MEARPRIQLALTTIDKAVEIIGWTVLVGMWVEVCMHYSKLPNTIPIHYNASGEADGFGDKLNIITLPLAATIIFIGMTVLNRFPHVFNYPTNITEDNALIQYTQATRLIRYLKLIIVFIFGLIAFKTIQNANGEAEGLGVWFLPITLGLIFVPMIYFIITSLNTKNKTKQ